MSEDLPFKAEYAKSGRAGCKTCKVTIGQDSLRIAKMVQSSHFDGKMPMWHHFECFFKKVKPDSCADIAGFDSLRWDDQQKIRGKVGGCIDSVDGRAGTSEDTNFSIEYSKSGRAKCRKCEDKIEKDVIRISKMGMPEDAKPGIGMVPRWYHLDCFTDTDTRSELAPNLSPEQIPGFKKISKEDQDGVYKKFGVKKGAKKKKNNGHVADEKPATAVKEKDENVKILKKQNKEYWKIRDSLFKSCDNSVIRTILEANNYDTHGGETSIVNRCTDGILFGALKSCPECKDGKLSYNAEEGYKCHGNISAWANCTYKTFTPERIPWEIPEELKEDNPFLCGVKLKVSERKFPLDVVNNANKTSTMNNEKPGLPLGNRTILFVGRLKGSKSTFKKMIEDLGGKTSDAVNESCFCCVSSPGEVLKLSVKMQKVQSCNIPVVAEEYITAIKNGGAESMLTQYAIAPWGGNRNSEEISKSSGKLKRKIEYEGESSTKKAKIEKVVMKGGAVVDPDSGKEDSCHLLTVSGVIYTVVLGLVDLTRGTNSYYKLQILEHDKKKNQYYLFRAWGRVGTTIGGNKLEKHFSRDEALSQFEDLYLDKTGNHWHKRKDFVKQPNRFYPVDIDYGQEDETLQSTIAPGSLSKLAEPVKDLIKLIFDVEAMKHALVEFEIDMKKMPLGKLSKKQIEMAYLCLSESQKYVTDGVQGGKVLDVSNRFYTLIPHDFGMQKPPLLDHAELINLKIKMLDSLLEIEIAYSILKRSKEDEDPVDVHYNGLKADINVVSKESEEFKMISVYVQNTHAKTHSNYSLDVEEVFEVIRKGERQKYRPFKDLHNRMLLWHGSRSTNYAGILSQGLRIAPKEAPVTGYMFGKGVYFADMASKSANYCNTNRSNPYGLMLLCEVALGNMYELTTAEHITKPPSGKQSCKGIGKTSPDPSMEKVLPDGVTVPIGTGIENKDIVTSLLYNEYIVYDTAQVNMKYLVKMKFNYKY